MKKKSKFVIFILSFMPGLSHFYIGFKERALIFFTLFLAVIFGVVGLCAMTNTNEFAFFLVFALPLIWFISLVDSISLVNEMEENSTGINTGTTEHEQPEKMEYQGILGLGLNNKKLITVGLSIVPGAGHMYLGLQNRGLQLMTIFFFSAFLMGWLQMSLFFFVLPIIWFYSIFDALHSVEDNNVDSVVREGDELNILNWFNSNPKWTGWGLILLGCLVAFERIVSRLITYDMRNYIQTGIVALILIGGGIRFLTGSKIKVETKKGEEDAKI